MAKSFKDYRKGKSPLLGSRGGTEGMDRDAGEPAYKKAYADPPGAVLDLECFRTQDFTVAQKQATVLTHPLDGGDEEVFFLF